MKRVSLPLVAALLFAVVLAPAVHAREDESLGTSIRGLPPEPEPGVDRNLFRIIGEVANFYDRVGLVDEAKKIRRQLTDGIFVLTPASQMNADHGKFDNGKILINREEIENTLFALSRGAKSGQQGLVSMAATIYHENLHAVQSDSTFVIGTIERELSNDNTRIEQEVWEKTFAMLAQWIDTLLKQRDAAATDAEREEAKAWLDAAIKGWNEYAGNIASHLDRKRGELRDTQWQGPGGITGTMAKNGQKESELWRKFRVWKAGLNSTTGPAGPALPTVSEEEILKSICRCSTSCTAGAYYNASPVDESPSCRDPGNGPCICSGWGCMRSVMSPACIVKVHQEQGRQSMGLDGVLRFIDHYDGKKLAEPDPASIFPLLRKGEALEMHIKVPGQQPERWLWRSADSLTFQATRLPPDPGSGSASSPGSSSNSSTDAGATSIAGSSSVATPVSGAVPAPATETVTLKAPSLGHLLFERSSTQGRILGARDLMNGGFSDGIADGLPEGSTVSAFIVKDPNPSQPVPSNAAPVAVASAPAPATKPLFTKPDRVDARGAYGLFEPVTTPMTLKGESFSSYQLQHPGSEGPTTAVFLLNGRVSRFTAKAAIDQSLHPEVPLGWGATARITVTGDGRVLYQSGVIDRNTALQNVEVGVQGVKELAITVDDSGDGSAFDWLVWGDPAFE